MKKFPEAADWTAGVSGRRGWDRRVAAGGWRRREEPVEESRSNPRAKNYNDLTIQQVLLFFSTYVLIRCVTSY